MKFDVLEAAIQYVNLGWSIIPIQIGKKTPVVSWKEYQTKRMSEEELTQYLGEFPESNLAVVCGSISGIVVLDIDPRNGGHASIMGKYIPETVTAETGGGGLHYFFKCTSRIQKRSSLLPGVDLQAECSYCVLPPSVHQSGKQYRWMLGKAPGQIELAEVPSWVLDESLVRPKSDHDISLNTIIREGAADGSRDDSATRFAGRLIGQGYSYADCLLIVKAWNTSRNRPPLSDEQIEKVVLSIWRAEEAKNIKAPSVQERRLGNRNIPTKTLATVVQEVVGGLIKKGEDERLYRYENGVYIPDAESVIRRTATELLGQVYSTAKVNETVSWFHNSLAPTLSLAAQPKGLINLSNGMLNIHTLQLGAHSPEIPSLIQLPIMWNPRAMCPNIDAFFRESLPADCLGTESEPGFIHEVIGYCLQVDVCLRKAFLLHGPTSSGKSTFLKIIHQMFGGKYASAVDLKSLCENRFMPAELYGKALNICGDIDNSMIEHSAIIKTITSEEVINAERKHGQPFSFAPKAKLLFSANDLPPTQDQGDAWTDRWVIIPFPNSRDEHFRDAWLNDALLLPEELSGLLLKAVLGLQTLLRRGYFAFPPSVVDARNKYRGQIDAVSVFADENLEFAAEKEVSSLLVYSKYKQWCDSHTRKPLSSQRFEGRLIELGRKSGVLVTKGENRLAGTNNRAYRGVCFKNSEVGDQGNQGVGISF